MDGPGRWNDRIRAKLAPRARTTEARTYLEGWHAANQRLADLPPDSSAHAELEAEIEHLRERYLAAVRADPRSTSDLDPAGGTA